MVKKKISFDIDIPDGYRKKDTKRKSSSRKKASKKRKTGRKKVKVEVPSFKSSAYNAYKKKLLQIVAEFLEEEFEIIVEGIKNIINLKKKVRALTFYLVFLIAGTAMIFFGIAKYIDCICPRLTCGASYMLVGLVAVVLALFYRRFSS